jgi:hypothetical protein
MHTYAQQAILVIVLADGWPDISNPLSDMA